MQRVQTRTHVLSMHSGNRHDRSIKEVMIEDKVIMIELQSVTPSLQPPVLNQTDLNDIDSWINFLHEIMSARACNLPPYPPPLWPTEVLNNYISFLRFIWLRAIILVPYHHSCFHIFYIGIGKLKWTTGSHYCIQLCMLWGDNQNFGLWCSCGWCLSSGEIKIGNYLGTLVFHCKNCHRNNTDE